MKIAEQFTIPSVMLPPTLKMCIGLIQVLVMIEISLHVDQNFKSYTIETQALKKKRTQVNIGDIIASQVNAKKWILLLRTFIILTVVSVIIACTIFYMLQEHKYRSNPLDKLEDISRITSSLSWGFLAVCVALVISTVLLMYCMSTRSPKIENLSATFKSETTNLSITLILFGLTYILRWVSDKSMSLR